MDNSTGQRADPAWQHAIWSVAPVYVPSGGGAASDAGVEGYYRSMEKYYELVERIVNVYGGGCDAPSTGSRGSCSSCFDLRRAFSVFCGCSGELAGADSRVGRDSRTVGAGESCDPIFRVGGVDVDTRGDVSSSGEGFDKLRTVGHVPSQLKNAVWPVHDSVSGEEFAGQEGNEQREGGASGLVSESPVRGPNYERNKAWKLERKERKRRNKDLGRTSSWRGNHVPHSGFFSSCSSETRDKLRQSRADLLIERNLRERVEEKHKVQVLEKFDVDSEVRRRQTQVRAAIERNMVSIEKTHATLAASGNIPGDFTGFAATILGSDSISPNSSASLQEFRACQKALLDSEARVERMVAAMEKAGIEIPYGPRTLKSMEHGDGIWTDNTENRNEWNERYSAYGIQDAEMYGLPGKVRVIPC